MHLISALLAEQRLLLTRKDAANAIAADILSAKYEFMRIVSPNLFE